MLPPHASSDICLAAAEADEKCLPEPMGRLLLFLISWVSITDGIFDVNFEFGAGAWLSAIKMKNSAANGRFLLESNSKWNMFVESGQCCLALSSNVLMFLFGRACLDGCGCDCRNWDWTGVSDGMTDAWLMRNSMLRDANVAWNRRNGRDCWIC